MLPYKSFSSVHLHKLLENHKDAFDWSIAMWHEFGAFPRYGTTAHRFGVSSRTAKNIVELAKFSIESPDQYAELLKTPAVHCRPPHVRKIPKTRKRKKHTKQNPKIPAKFYVADEIIYFIKAHMPNAIKIGRTASKAFYGRFSNLQTSNPSLLTILATIPGNRETERELHNRFQDLLISGEWFRYEEPLVSFVLSLSN